MFYNIYIHYASTKETVTNVQQTTNAERESLMRLDAALREVKRETQGYTET